MGTRFIKARFHIDTGPEALFERVHYKMDSVKTVGTRAPRVTERAAQWRIPQEVLDRVEDFGTADWELVA